MAEKRRRPGDQEALRVLPAGRAIPVPHDLVEPPTLRVHPDGRTEVEWTHGRGATFITADLLEVAVARANDATAAEQQLRGQAAHQLRALASMLRRMAAGDPQDEEVPGLRLAAIEADDRADAIESGKLRLPPPMEVPHG